LNNAVTASEFSPGYAVTPAVKSYATSIFHKEAHKSIITKKLTPHLLQARPRDSKMSIMMRTEHKFSKDLLRHCKILGVRFVK